MRGPSRRYVARANRVAAATGTTRQRVSAVQARLGQRALAAGLTSEELQQLLARVAAGDQNARRRLDAIYGEEG